MGLINVDIPAIPKQKMEEFLWVISGVNKIGKTTLANEFPKPYFFLFEHGSSSLLTYETNCLNKARELDKHAWLVFEEAVEEFVANDGYGFKTAVVDPISTAYEFCEDYVCKEVLEIDHVSDLPYGKGYAEVKDRFVNVVRKLSTGSFTSVLISHTKDKNKKDGLGNEVDVIDLDITGKAGKFIKNFTDVLLLLDFNNEGERKIFIRPSTNQEAGSRLVFENNEIELSYNALKKEFDKAIKNNNKKLGVTPDMIEQYYKFEKVNNELQSYKNQIIELCKKKGITPVRHKKLLSETVEKSFDELTIEDAKTYIEFLKKNV